MYILGLITAAAMLPMAAGSSEIKPGTITVVGTDEENATASVANMYADTVEHALLRTPFTVLPYPSHSRYIATVEVVETLRGVVVSGGPRTPTAPNLTYGGGRLSLALPSNKTRLRELREIRLKVSVSLRGDKHIVWTGEAITVRPTGRGSDEASAAIDLSNALLAQFPSKIYGPLSIP